MSKYTEQEKDAIYQAYFDRFQSSPCFEGMREERHETDEFYGLIKKAAETGDQTVFDEYVARDVPDGVYV